MNRAAALTSSQFVNIIRDASERRASYGFPCPLNALVDFLNDIRSTPLRRRDEGQHRGVAGILDG